MQGYLSSCRRWQLVMGRSSVAFDPRQAQRVIPSLTLKRFAKK